MRLKAIPQAATKALANPWVLGGGAAVLAVAAVIYFRGQGGAPVEDTSSGQSYNALGGYAPVSLGYGTGGSDALSAAVSDGISGAAGIGQLVELQKLTAGFDYDLSLKQIQANSDIANVQASVSMASIQSANFAIQANIANAFASQKDNAGLFGTIGGPTGALTLNLYKANDNGSDSKHDFLIKLINSGAGNTAINQGVAGYASSVNVTNQSQPQGTMTSPGTIAPASYSAPAAAISGAGGGRGISSLTVNEA